MKEYHKKWERIISIFSVGVIFVFLLTACHKTSQKQQPVTPQTALNAYLNNQDTTFSWQLKNTTSESSLKIYSMLLTSQRWHGIVWRHTLTMIVPDENKYDGAMLFITGGKNANGMPVKRSHDDEFIATMEQLALKHKATVAIIWQVPNQPLFNDLTEDQLISYTLHQFENDTDYTWPLLFPMVKSAVRAMDAVQQFSENTLNHPVHRFVVTGASKRGWTTWLTGAMDKRTEAIAPMVIDVLNMPVNLDYQVKAWGDYSIQIEDYVKLGIPQEVHSGKGSAIAAMVDPYSYRKKLTMPKLIINGTNDEYWPVDAIKNYLDEIPGENYLLYVQNAGHGLGDKKKALTSLGAFFGRTLARKPYPQCKWNVVREDTRVVMSVETSHDELLGVHLWSAVSQDRDFRKAVWNGQEITAISNDPVQVSVDLPASGYKAFFVDLEYRDPNGGSCNKSTRTFVLNPNGLDD
ncbi:MAG: PhoPQ-activated pathogenicity-like protein PqaA type [Bacteroidales bacterium]|nr:PhoPQ-activated pathogenicity-like protein PqaA type [Bacteroidales bacterium]